MITNRSVPACSVIPVLVYDDAMRAADWLCNAFGFVERLRIGTHRAQLLFGDGAVILSQRTLSGGAHNSAPTHSVHVRVAEVDAHCARAREHGAVIVDGPADYPYGERQYTAQDIEGHCWTFSQSIADVDPKDWGATVPR